MASNTDKFRKTAAGPITTLGVNISATDTVVQMASTSGYPTDTAIDICIDRVDADGNLTPEKMEIMTVVINGNSGTFAYRGRGGTVQPHVAGAIIEPSINSAANHNDLIDGILKALNQDGTLRDSVIAAVRQSVMPALTADIKDAAITTAKLAAKSVTNEKLGDAAVKSNNLDYSTINYPNPILASGALYSTSGAYIRVGNNFTLPSNTLILIRCTAGGYVGNVNAQFRTVRIDTQQPVGKDCGFIGFASVGIYGGTDGIMIVGPFASDVELRVEGRILQGANDNTFAWDAYVINSRLGDIKI